MSPHSLDDRAVEDVLRDWAQGFDVRFAALFDDPGDVPGDLVEVVRYAATSGGKRLRPFLVTRCCELCGGSVEDAWAASAAIECVHTFSLIHDDLPAMDDDDVRRGMIVVVVILVNVKL